MLTCEKCEALYDRSQLESVLVILRDTSRQHCSLCLDCWDKIQPGEWVKLPGRNGEGKEIRRVYWACDLCNGVFAWSAVTVLINTLKIEYIVCKECKLGSSLKTKM